MQITKKRRKTGDVGMNMTPMIDVVFQLIIFFMLVNVMSKQEIEQIRLPQAKEGIDDKNPPKGRIIINVLENGDVFIHHNRYASGADRSQNRGEQLYNFLDRHAQQRMASQRPPVSELPVKIRADAECSYKYVQNVMVQCMRAYVWKLSFGCAPGGGKKNF